MDLTSSEEPVNTVAHFLTILILSIGAGILAVNAGWSSAPDWFKLLSIGTTAVLASLGTQVARVATRNSVYPVAKVDAFLAHAQAVEPGPTVTIPATIATLPATDGAPTQTVDMDAVVEAAGLNDLTAPPNTTIHTSKQG